MTIKLPIRSYSILKGKCWLCEGRGVERGASRFMMREMGDSKVRILFSLCASEEVTGEEISRDEFEALISILV